MTTKRNISPLRISPFSWPNLGEDQKKRSSLKFSPVFGPNLGEDQENKKGLHPDSVRLCAQTFCPRYKGGEHAAILHTILTILCKLYYPGTMGPPKCAPAFVIPNR